MRRLSIEKFLKGNARQAAHATGELGKSGRYHACNVAAGKGFTMSEFVNSDAFRAANLPFSQAVRAGGMLFLSGCIGNVAGKMELAPGGIEAESRQMMENIGAVLNEAGSDWSRVVKCVVYLADLAEWGAFNTVYLPYFAAGRYPARTAVGVKELILGARVEMECWAEAV
jgi:reactive intermediate/imine deaminase